MINMNLTEMKEHASTQAYETERKRRLRQASSRYPLPVSWIRADVPPLTVVPVSCLAQFREC